MESNEVSLKHAREIHSFIAVIGLLQTSCWEHKIDWHQGRSLSQEDLTGWRVATIYRESYWLVSLQTVFPGEFVDTLPSLQGQSIFH